MSCCLLSFQGSVTFLGLHSLLRTMRKKNKRTDLMPMSLTGKIIRILQAGGKKRKKKQSANTAHSSIRSLPISADHSWSPSSSLLGEEEMNKRDSTRAAERAATYPRQACHAVKSRNDSCNASVGLRFIHLLMDLLNFCFLYSTV